MPYHPRILDTKFNILPNFNAQGSFLKLNTVIGTDGVNAISIERIHLS